MSRKRSGGGALGEAGIRGQIAGPHAVGAQGVGQPADALILVGRGVGGGCSR